MHNLVFAQYFATAISSAFNTYYFIGYRSSTKRRRIGAVALALMSLGIFIESLYFGFFALYQDEQWASDFFLHHSYWLGARLLLCLGTLLISALILRHLVAKRR